jgi:hypothetical protein
VRDATVLPPTKLDAQAYGVPAGGLKPNSTLALGGRGGRSSIRRNPYRGGIPFYVTLCPALVFLVLPAWFVAVTVQVYFPAREALTEFLVAPAMRLPSRLQA